MMIAQSRSGLTDNRLVYFGLSEFRTADLILSSTSSGIPDHELRHMMCADWVRK